mgnify:CR=1 FL=1
MGTTMKVIGGLFAVIYGITAISYLAGYGVKPENTNLIIALLYFIWSDTIKD